MKAVNFKELSIETSIDEYEVLDLRKEVGNTIHRHAMSVPLSELARKIYYSEGAVSIADEDYSVMISIIEKSFIVPVSKAIKESTREIEKVGQPT